MIPGNGINIQAEVLEGLRTQAIGVLQGMGNTGVDAQDMVGNATVLAQTLVQQLEAARLKLKPPIGIGKNDETTETKEPDSPVELGQVDLSNDFDKIRRTIVALKETQANTIASQVKGGGHLGNLPPVLQRTSVRNLGRKTILKSPLEQILLDLEKLKIISPDTSDQNLVPPIGRKFKR